MYDYDSLHRKAIDLAEREKSGDELGFDQMYELIRLFDCALKAETENRERLETLIIEIELAHFGIE